MLDQDFSISQEQKACTLSILSSKVEFHKSEKEVKTSLVEMKELLSSLNIPVVHSAYQKKENLDPATILGRGKILEVAKEAEAMGASLLVLDLELTASQIRNIKNLTGLSVIDRVHVILEIFSEHARTREAKIQIELARLGYILPRLSGFWTHLGRQKGGVGVRGGEGEQQIELDRRIIRNKIEKYKRELVEVRKSREQQKKKRKNKAITAALVGYTNAGKSSLMNRLCRVNILEQDKLFATLDSTFRMLNPDTKPPMILIDTVGFISNLPNTLIDGFRTTLESALEADLLIHVCDLSDDNFEQQMKVTTSVLKELNIVNKEQLFVFNKSDLVTDPMRKKLVKRLYPNSFIISSFDKEDINELRKFIIDYFLKRQNSYDLFIPYKDGEYHSRVQSMTNVVKTSSLEDGIYYKIRIPEKIYKTLMLQKYELAPSSPLIQA